jgi:outer membrane receptor for Fe3+-dicitrate
VAEDIGKLPDRNIADALQRISGIQIQRNYGEAARPPFAA